MKRKLGVLESNHPGESSVPVFGSKGAEETHCRAREKREEVSGGRGEKRRKRKERDALVDEIVPMK